MNYADKIAKELINVQPMPEKLGELFSMKGTYKETNHTSWHRVSDEKRGWK